MEQKVNKEEDKKPADPEDEKSKKAEEPNSVEDRIGAIESKVNKLIESVTASKQEDEDKPEEEKKKEEEEDKKPEEDKDPEEEKKKEEGEPKPGAGEVKLPKAPAGETDESAKPEGDKVQIMEKQIEDKVTKKVEDIMKSKGWVPSGKTPRAPHEIAKRKEEKPTNLAMDLLTKAKKGEITVAELNRTVKGFVNKNYTAALREFIEKGRKEVA